MTGGDHNCASGVIGPHVAKLFENLVIIRDERGGAREQFSINRRRASQRRHARRQRGNRKRREAGAIGHVEHNARGANGDASVTTRQPTDCKSTRSNPLPNGGARDRDEARSYALGKSQESGRQLEERLPHSGDVHDEVVTVLAGGKQRHRGWHDDDLTSTKIKYFLYFMARRATGRHEHRAVFDGTSQLPYPLMRSRLTPQWSKVVN
jgi:hypothetical protein